VVQVVFTLAVLVGPTTALETHLVALALQPLNQAAAEAAAEALTAEIEVMVATVQLVQ
jgi:hypothetical protein